VPGTTIDNASAVADCSAAARHARLPAAAPGAGRLSVPSDSTSVPPLLPNRLERLEALRGLAAFYVVVHHVVPEQWVVGGVNVALPFRFGQEAVILFFLLSGFVIHYSFTKGRDKSFGSYFAKRALRIYVPLIVVLVTAYLVKSWDEGGWAELVPHVLLGNLLMLQDWEWAKPGGVVRTYLGNTPLWSLSYEWWFYMLYWPLWRVFAMSGRNTVVRDSIALGLPVVAALVYVFLPIFAVRIVMYFSIWWAGAMIAEAYMSGRLDRPRAVLPPFASMAAITLILLANAYVLNRDEGIPLIFGRHPLVEARHFGFAVFAFAAALLWRRLNWRGFDSLTGVGRVLAPISYTLYISHWFLLAEASYLGFVGNRYVEFVGYVLVTVAFCWAVECVLYPAIRRRFMARRHAPPASPATASP